MRDGERAAPARESHAAGRAARRPRRGPADLRHASEHPRRTFAQTARAWSVTWLLERRRWRAGSDAQCGADAEAARAGDDPLPSRRLRRPAVIAPRSPRHLSPAAARRLHLRRRHRARALSRAARHQPRLLLALLSRAAGQHARLRRGRSQRRSIRRSARARISKRFVATLRAHGMGQIVDFVPNHVGVMGADNAWWMDVLENGPASRVRRVLRHRLGARRSRARGQGARAGARRPVRHGARARRAAAALRARDRQLRRRSITSIASRSIRASIRASSTRALARLRGRRAVGRGTARLRRACVDAFGHLPAARRCRPRAHRRAPARQGGAQATAARLLGARAPVARRLPIDAAALNGDTATRELRRAARAARSAGLSARVLARRRRTRSTTAASSTSTISPRCAWRTTRCSRRRTRFVLELRGATASVDGLRIDHPDGLYDPARVLRAAAARRRSGRGPAAYIVGRRRSRRRVRGRCPSAWPVHGTTGYGFANVVERRCSSIRAREPRLERIYRRVHRRAASSGTTWPTRPSGSSCGTSLAAELNVLANQLARIAQRGPAHARLHAQQPAPARSREVIACFPGLPHVHRRRACRTRIAATSTGPIGARAPAQPRDRRGRLRFRARRAARELPAADPRTRAPPARAFAHEVPAGHRARDGQGRRGHRVLPLHTGSLR